MTMENSKKYFDKCLNCDEYYARNGESVEICSLCFDKISMDLVYVLEKAEKYLLEKGE
mgnify:FL=1